MRLGIDLDGVVADFTNGWVRRYNQDFGTSIDPLMVKTWGAMPELTHFASMGEFWRWVAGGDGRPSVFRDLDPYPGAVEALWRLRGARHDIVVLSTKPGFAVHDTFAWIAEHKIPTREVHLTEDKAAIACDIYLEDAPHQLEELVAQRPEAMVCRFVRPWNAPVSGAADIDSWQQFIDLVEAHPLPSAEAGSSSGRTQG